jgi:hypothetical protein
MAYSLANFGAIEPARLARILAIVQAVGALYGLFDAPATEPGDDPDADDERDLETRG